MVFDIVFDGNIVYKIYYWVPIIIIIVVVVVVVAFYFYFYYYYTEGWINLRLHSGVTMGGREAGGMGLLIVHNKCDGEKIIAMPSSWPPRWKSGPPTPFAPPPKKNKPPQQNKTQNKTKQTPKQTQTQLRHWPEWYFSTVFFFYLDSLKPSNRFLCNGVNLWSMVAPALTYLNQTTPILNVTASFNYHCPPTVSGAAKHSSAHSWQEMKPFFHRMRSFEVNMPDHDFYLQCHLLGWFFSQISALIAIQSPRFCSQLTPDNEPWILINYKHLNSLLAEIKYGQRVIHRRLKIFLNTERTRSTMCFELLVHIRFNHCVIYSINCVYV